MNELQRMQYLDAMGIETFVPRFVLPHAKNSSQCELPAPRKDISPTNPSQSAPLAKIESKRLSAIANVLADEPEAQTSSSPVNEEASIASTDNAKKATSSAPQAHNRTDMAIQADNHADNLSSKNAELEPVAKKPNTTELSPLAVKTGESSLVNAQTADKADRSSASFCLSLWRVSDDVLVIDSRLQSEPLPTERLLINILKAVNLSHGLLPKLDKLQWPLVNDASKDNSWHAAQEMVHYFLEGRLFTSPVKYLFLFGSDAQKAVLKNDQVIQAQKMPADAFACEAYCFESLSQLLKEPLLKKPVWSLLSSDFLMSQG